jgi:hypothetical protein
MLFCQSFRVLKVDGVKVHARVLFHRFDQGQAFKTFLEKSISTPSKVTVSLPSTFWRHGTDEVFNKVHHTEIVGVRLKQFQHRELRCAARIALIAETRQFRYTRSARRQSPLVIQFQRNTQNKSSSSELWWV